MDLITQQSILAKLPEIQRRRRRAEQLKAQQQGFADMIASGQEETNYQPAQEGGWFKTVQQRRPDYGALGKQLAGGLGGLYAQHKAEKEAQGLDEYLNPEIIGAIGQIPQARDAQMQTQSGKPSNYQGANAQTLQAYLGMIGGPDVAGSGNLRSTQKLKNGNLGLVYDSGVVDSGIPFDYSIKTEKNAQGDWFGIGTSGAGRGVANPIVPGDVAPPGGGIAGGMQFPSQPSQPSAPSQPSGSIYDRIWKAESGATMDPNLVSEKGARGPMQLMPETAREIEQKLGMSPGLTDTDPEANRKAGEFYFNELKEKYGREDLAVAAYNWGMGNVDKWLAAGADPAALPAETRDYVRKIYSNEGTQPPAGANATVPGPAAPAARGPLRSLTAAEEEAQKLAAQAGSAENITAIEQAKKEGALTAESIATSKAKLPGAEARQREMERDINFAVNSPELDKIVGGSIAGRASAMPFGRQLGDFLLGAARIEGDKGSDLNTLLNRLENVSFVEAYANEMRGTGAVSNIEGLMASQANLRSARSQSPEKYREALKDFLMRHQQVVEALRRNAQGITEPEASPFMPSPALAIPAGAQWLD